MKKVFLNLLFVLLMLIAPVNADVFNEADIQEVVSKLDNLATFNPYNFFNKSEIIGYRRDQFEMSTNQYRTTVIAVKDRINKNTQELYVFQDDQQMPEDTKNVQMGRIYQDINFALAELDTSTYNYINNLRWFMPTLTYQRYYKSFLNYYQQLNIKNYH